MVIAGGTGNDANAVGFARLTIILLRSVDCAPGLKGTGARRLQWRSGEEGMIEGKLGGLMFPFKTKCVWRSLSLFQVQLANTR